MIPTTAFFILKSSKVQTYLTHKITKEISENLNTKIEVESVHFRFFNRIVLKNVYIEDLLQDTLLFSKEVICNINKFDNKKRIIDISNISLVEAKFYLNKYDLNEPLYLTYLINSYCLYILNLPPSLIHSLNISLDNSS